MGKRRGCWLGTACRDIGLASHFLRTPGEVILRNILQIMQRTSKKVVECACVIASLKLS